jgi:hypothetical protein
MSTGEVDILDEGSRKRIAAEVIELGEALFETALEAGSYRSAEGQEGEAYPVEEIRAATDEFFTALRLLLGIEE